MRYYVENTLRSFNAWAGGLQNLKMLCEHPDAYDYMENWFEDYCNDPDFPVADTVINDILWFEMYDILFEAGFVNEDHEWPEEVDDEEEE